MGELILVCLACLSSINKDLPKIEVGCDGSHRSQRPLGTILISDEADIV
jgi:hypothetical protein